MEGGGGPPLSVKKKSIKNWPKNGVFWAKNAVFGEKNSVFGNGPFVPGVFETFPKHISLKRKTASPTLFGHNVAAGFQFPDPPHKTKEKSHKIAISGEYKFRWKWAFGQKVK